MRVCGGISASRCLAYHDASSEKLQAPDGPGTPLSSCVPGHPRYWKVYQQGEHIQQEIYKESLGAWLRNSPSSLIETHAIVVSVETWHGGGGRRARREGGKATTTKGPSNSIVYTLGAQISTK